MPSVFVRTSGCNLRCVWCDTPYTSWKPEGREMSEAEILAEVAQFPARHVVVTGGEPMMLDQVVPLTHSLRAAGAAHHRRDGRHRVSARGLRPDEHQSQASQLHTTHKGRRQVGAAARSSAVSAGSAAAVDGVPMITS